ESLVDLDALYVLRRPAGALERLAHRGHGTDPEHAGLHRGDAVGHDAAHGLHAVLLRPRTVGDDHRGRTRVEAGRVARGDAALLAERGLQFRERLERRFRTVVLVLVERHRALAAGQVEPHDLFL